LESYSFDVSAQLLALSDTFLDSMHRDVDLPQDNWIRVVLLDPEWKRRRENRASLPAPITMRSDLNAGDLRATMVLVIRALEHSRSLLRDARFALSPEAAKREFQSQVELYEAVWSQLLLLGKILEGGSSGPVN
jgi:hypothetical protein